MLAVQNPNGSRWNIVTVIGRVVNAVRRRKGMTRSIVFPTGIVGREEQCAPFSERERGKKSNGERGANRHVSFARPGMIKYDRLPVVCAPSSCRLYHRGDRRRKA